MKSKTNEYVVNSLFDFITIMKEHHFDPIGLIVQANGDEGDTLNRTPLYYALLLFYLTNNKNEISPEDLGKLEWALRLKWGLFSSLIKLEPESGKFVRHPNPQDKSKSWMSDWRTTSRDQLSPLAWSSIVIGSNGYLNRHAWYLLTHFGFYPNVFHIGEKYFTQGAKLPDFVGPSQVADIFRGLNWWFAYPLILILDLGLIVNACLRIGKTPENDSGTNDICGYMHYRYAMIKYKTPFAFLAWKIYSLTNPLPRIKHYFRRESHAPPLWWLFEKDFNNVNFKKRRNDK